MNTQDERTAFQTRWADAAEKVFLRNAAEARENGYDTLCAECGTGLAFDGGDLHDSYCSLFDQEAFEREMRG